MEVTSGRFNGKSVNIVSTALLFVNSHFYRLFWYQRHACKGTSALWAAGLEKVALSSPSLRMDSVYAKDNPMGHREEGQNLERLFTLSEANQLIPQLEDHLSAIRQAKAVLIRTKDEIKKASSKSQFGGGSFAGHHYISALEHISEHLRAIQEIGVLVKDLDIGLCDFPHQMEGRIVYLCWKCGETEIRWWHEIHSGYTGRQPLEP